MRQALCGLQVPEGTNPIHNWETGVFVISFCDFDIEEQLYLLNVEEVNRICLARNPYTRFLSRHWNKIDGQKKYGNINESIFKSISIKEQQGVSSFFDFLKLIMKSNKNQLVIHFRMQSRIAPFNQLDYYFTGHLENFQEDLIRILKNLCANQKILNSVGTIEKHSIKNTRLSSSLLYDLSKQKLVTIFFIIFKADLINFIYEKYQ